MDTIFHGSLASAAGRRLAWIDSMFVDHGVFRLVWSNGATVVPGRLYRSNHPSPARLRRAVQRHGIRSVINLRGQCGNGSDALSREAARRLGLHFMDVPIQSGRPPPRDRLLALVAALEAAPVPILVHCKSGADRAGFAAGIYLLLMGSTAKRAAEHLSWRFGHLRGSRAGVLDAFFETYAVEAEGRKSFREWLSNDYAPTTLCVRTNRGRLAGYVQDTLLRRE